MMTARESVLSIQRLKSNDPNKALYLIKSIERDDFPRTNKMIRMDMFKGVEYTKLEEGGL